LDAAKKEGLKTSATFRVGGGEKNATVHGKRRLYQRKRDNLRKADPATCVCAEKVDLSGERGAISDFAGEKGRAGVAAPLVKKKRRGVLARCEET